MTGAVHDVGACVGDRPTGSAGAGKKTWRLGLLDAITAFSDRNPHQLHAIFGPTRNKPPRRPNPFQTILFQCQIAYRGAMSPRSTKVLLSEKQIGFADQVALGRRTRREASGSLHKNGGPQGDYALSLRRDILGARTELAAKVYLDPVRWDTGERPGGADLEDWIDVKGVELGRHKLIVQRDAVDDWAYLLVNAEFHPTYEIIGWAWGREAKKIPMSGPRPAHFIGRREVIFRSPQELFEEVRRRQAAQVLGSQSEDLARRCNI